MIFHVLFGETKLKVGYYDLETLRNIAESNNIKFVALYTDSDKQNEKDLEDVPSELLKKIKVYPITHIEDLIPLAFDK